MKYCKYILFCLVLIGAGCSGSYKGVPREAMLMYQTSPTLGNVYTLGRDYAEAINRCLKADTLHPGLYADYGVALALMGHKDAAARALQAEAKAFPQSRAMMERLHRQLLPDTPIDTFGMTRVDTALYARWAYDSATALLAVGIAPVIDSTDSVRIMLQTPVDSAEYPIRITATQKRIMLAEQQKEAERMRKAKADSVAAAKQAVKDARQQEAANKKEAKKQAEKQRKQEAKEREKAKNAEREKLQQQREAERKARAEARKKKTAKK